MRGMAGMPVSGLPACRAGWQRYLSPKARQLKYYSTVSRPTVVTPPTIEPLTVDEAKKQVELSGSDDTHDEHLVEIIQSAREQWEHDTDSALLTQTLRVEVDLFDSEMVRLPSRPVQSVSSITYYDSGNVQQTVSTDIYSLDANNRAVRLKYDQLWPDTIERWDAISITYVAGYTSRRLVPSVAKQAMRLLVGYYFENRDMLANDLVYTTAAYERLVKRYMRATYP